MVLYLVGYRLVDVGRRLDKADNDGIRLVAQHLCRLKQLNYATEMYRKLADERSIVQLYVQAREWKEAFAIIDSRPEFKDQVYVPYAQWLAENDKFVEAQKGMPLNNEVRKLPIFKICSYSRLILCVINLTVS
jgi:hypothetical protein